MKRTQNKISKIGGKIKCTVEVELKCTDYSYILANCHFFSMPEGCHIQLDKWDIITVNVNDVRINTI